MFTGLVRRPRDFLPILGYTYSMLNLQFRVPIFFRQRLRKIVKSDFYVLVEQNVPYALRRTTVPASGFTHNLDLV